MSTTPEKSDTKITRAIPLTTDAWLSLINTDETRNNITLIRFVLMLERSGKHEGFFSAIHSKMFRDMFCFVSFVRKFDAIYERFLRK